MTTKIFSGSRRWCHAGRSYSEAIWMKWRKPKALIQTDAVSEQDLIRTHQTSSSLPCIILMLNPAFCVSRGFTAIAIEASRLTS